MKWQQKDWLAVFFFGKAVATTLSIVSFEFNSICMKIAIKRWTVFWEEMKLSALSDQLPKSPRKSRFFVRQPGRTKAVRIKLFSLQLIQNFDSSINSSINGASLKDNRL